MGINGRRRRVVVLSGLCAGAALVAACVGDEPATPPIGSGGDAGGGSDTSTSSDTSTGTDTGTQDSSSDSAPVDAGPCDLKKPFGPPKLVPNINTTSNENAARISHDGLTMYIDSDRPAGGGGDAGAEILVSVRGNLTDDFPTPSTLAGTVNTGGYEGFPSVTADHKAMFFASNTGGGPLRMYVATRNAVNAPFTAPDEVPGGGADNDTQPWIGASGVIYMATSRTVVFPKLEVWRYTPLGGGNYQPTSIAELNTSGRTSMSPTLSDDELTIYWGADRDTANDVDIWKATRGTKAESFTGLTKVTELSTTQLEYPVYLDPTGCTLYYSAFRGTSGVGQRDIWVATKPK